MSRFYSAVLIQLRQEKALTKHSLHEKIAVSVLLKQFITGNEKCYTTNTPLRMSGALFLNVNNIQPMIPEDQKNITTQ